MAIKALDFTSASFCDICLESTIDGEKRYTSKDIMYRSSNFLKALLDDAPKEEILVKLDVSSESIDKLLTIIYSEEINVGANVLSRVQISELIYLLNYLAVDYPLKMVLSEYKKRFSEYGPIDVTALANINSVFNVFPDIRNLYSIWHIVYLRNSNLENLDYTDVRKDIVAKTLWYSVNPIKTSLYHPPNDVFSKSGDRYVIARDKEKKLYLSTISHFQGRKGFLVHFCGWTNNNDEVVSKDNIYPLKKEGKFISRLIENEKIWEWIANSLDSVFINFFQFLKNKTSNPVIMMRDLQDVPDIFKTLPEYNEAFLHMEKLQMK